MVVQAVLCSVAFWEVDKFVISWEAVASETWTRPVYFGNRNQDMSESFLLLPQKFTSQIIVTGCPIRSPSQAEKQQPVMILEGSGSPLWAGTKTGTASLSSTGWGDPNDRDRNEAWSRDSRLQLPGFRNVTGCSDPTQRGTDLGKLGAEKKRPNMEEA